MVSIYPPTFSSPRAEPIPHTLNFINSKPKFIERVSQSGISLSRVSDSTVCCRCVNDSTGGRDDSDSSSEGFLRWDFGIQERVRNAIKGFDDYVSSFMDRTMNNSVSAVDDVEDEWDWERWRMHFVGVDDRERLVSILKSQLARAIAREDYEEAATIKVAIAAATTNDTVGRVMSSMKKFVEKEQYRDAADIRDHAGAGLVGWWAGISEDANDPYGHIIRITAEYGRYIAKSYNPRQLAASADGIPLFEVYLTNNKNGDYNQQAVYLKRKGATQDLYVPSFKSSGSSRSLDSRDARDNRSKLFERSSEDTDSEDRDDDSSFDNVLRDMIPGVEVKVVKVTEPEKVDRDIISKVIEQIVDEDGEEKDSDLETTDTEDEIESEKDEEPNDIELDSVNGITADNGQNSIAVEVVVGVSDGFIQKMTRGTNIKDLLRVPARLEKTSRLSFKFTVEEDANEHLSGGDGQSPQDKKAKLQGQRSIDHVMLDIVKSIGKGKISAKVVEHVHEFVNRTLNQVRNRQPLSGSTTFNRIDVSSSSDALNGLYIGAHGLYNSEVIHMRRRFGQWKEGANSKNPSKLEFYEYVEAVKLTGDASFPAGQVAFRAKVGKRYQLPHKGIIPEEFGVIARFRGQGRLAESGFKNPRWVDGELVILDGKYIKGGPVVGFIYWAPEYHFLMFFNRLRLLD